jgi:nucleoside-diphosphate-sugar epimerase
LSELATSKNSSFEFYELDLLDGLPASILEDIDTVVHLADVVGGIKYVFNNQFDVFNLNVLIDANTVKAVANSKVKKYIYAGTACSFPHQLQNNVDSMLFETEKARFPESMNKVELVLQIRKHETEFEEMKKEEQRLLLEWQKKKEEMKF